jgi:IS1 family transposase
MIVPEDKALLALQLLIEGTSIRSIERITGLHRDTIVRLLVAVGECCIKLMDARMVNLPCKRLESEIWTFVSKKQRRVQKDDPAEFGDAWVFVAIDPVSKLVPSFVVGKRDMKTTNALIGDLKPRLANRVQLSTDGFRFYVDAVEKHFGADIDFGQVVKLYGDYGQHDAEGRYSPAPIVEVITNVRQGNPNPDYLSTSMVERNNLTMRMAIRRFTRLTNAHSKKLENLKAACALHFAYYNFCRIHSTTRCRPAMEAGITDHIWNLEELLS